MIEKLITVITATYNAGATLERCIQSVLCQKTSDIEYLVVDGASTDNTLEIIDKYREGIDIVISEPDKGVYDAWNKALALCHGKWIMFLGADDYYVDNIFSMYKQFLATKETENIDLVSAKCQLINANEVPLRVFGAPYKWQEFRNKNRLSHGSALHNRKLFDEVGKFDIRYNISADYELLLRKKLNALFMDEVVIYMQDGGMSYSADGLIQTFMVKHARHSSDLPHDIYYLIKGLTGFYLRKIFWSITKK